MKQEDLERLGKILESVERAAKLIAEHEASRAFRNGVPRLGSETILSLSREGLEILGQAKRTE